MHQGDAEKIGLNGNTHVRVSSKKGQVTLPVEITNEIMPGIVSIPHGWGHSGEINMKVAQSNPGVSINDLTDDSYIDALTGNAALNGVPVKVEPA